MCTGRGGGELPCSKVTPPWTKKYDGTGHGVSSVAVMFCVSTEGNGNVHHPVKCSFQKENNLTMGNVSTKLSKWHVDDKDDIKSLNL